MEKYHRYIWDYEKQRFLGHFEEMYRAEEVEGFDSWHQDDGNERDWAFHLRMLEPYSCPRILDLGCGKGAFTNLLAQRGSRVVGVDLSPTAIEKARSRFPSVEFRATSVDEALEAKETFDLVTALAVLYYLENWRDVLARLSRMTTWLYATLNFPQPSLSFISNPDEFLSEVARHFEIEFYVVKPKGRHYSVMARALREGTT